MKISIITATFNCRDTILDTINSIRNQDYTNIEHVIIDGNSSDGSVDIIKALLTESSLFLSEADFGIYDALNKGISLSTGNVIGFLHSDDIYSSNDVLGRVASIFHDPSVCAVYGNLNYVSRNDLSKVVRRWRSSDFVIGSLSRGWMPPHPTLFVRRDWYIKFQGFDRQYRISADYDCILKFFSDPFFKSIYIDKDLIKMRLGGISNNSLHNLFCKSREDWRILRNFGFGYLQAIRALTFKMLRKVFQFI